MFWVRQETGKLDDLSDVELANRLVAGDTDAFNAFYKRYGRLIYYCIQQSTDLAPDDIFQEFFLRLQGSQFRALAQWERSRPLPSFLRAIVKNFVIDRHRSEKRHKNHSDIDDNSNQNLVDQAPTGQDLREKRDLRRGGINAWLKLSSPRDQRLICGKFHRETPPAVAAEREGLSSGAYRKALFDAQKRYLLLVQQAVPEYFA